MPDDIRAQFEALRSFMFEALYYNPVAKSEEGKVEELVQRLYRYFSAHPEQLPEEYAMVYHSEGACRAACDYVSGMSDNFALAVYHDVYIPKGWSVVHEQL